jgi:hypothetical protein
MIDMCASPGAVWCAFDVSAVACDSFNGLPRAMPVPDDLRAGPTSMLS